MPWYLKWLEPLLKRLAKKALEWGLRSLETKFPGLKPLIEEIIDFVEREFADGNVGAVRTMRERLL